MQMALFGQTCEIGQILPKTDMLLKICHNHLNYTFLDFEAVSPENDKKNSIGQNSDYLQEKKELL